MKYRTSETSLTQQISSFHSRLRAQTLLTSLDLARFLHTLVVRLIRAMTRLAITATMGLVEAVADVAAVAN